MGDFPNFQDLFRVGRDEALVRNGKLTKASIEREGGDANILNAAAAAVGDEVVGQLVRIEAASFLDSAEKAALDRLIWDRYGLRRKPAANGLVLLRFTTTSPTPSLFAIDVNARVGTEDGVEYQTIETVPFPMGSIGPVQVIARSVLAGASQQVKAATLTSIKSQITGSPSDLAVTNLLASAGADDEEPDPDYRARARSFFPSARIGTMRAIEVAALGVPGIRSATAFVALDVLGRPARFVELVVSDAFAESLVLAGTIPPSYSAQALVLSSSVSAALADVRAGGIHVLVTFAVPVLQTVQLALAFQWGVTPSAVSESARAAIVAQINSLRPGATLKRSDLVNVLRSVSGLIVTGNEIVTPAADVTCQPIQVIRSSTSLVAVISGVFAGQSGTAGASTSYIYGGST